MFRVITPRGYQKKLKLKKVANTVQHHAHAYEPTNIVDTYDSALWRWRRVAEWERYINDPVENNNGHMITV